MEIQSTPKKAKEGTRFTWGGSKISVDIGVRPSEPIENSKTYNSFSKHGENESLTVHPLDVLCALLHCSDAFLQQEIVTRLSMCQVAVPLLLPPGYGTECTLLLWAMRDIIKHLPSPTGTGDFIEEHLVNIPMPLISFVRLGECKNISKSKLLNQVLSFDSHSSRNDFVHHQMSCGKGSKKISDGLVEITWFFPSKNTAPHCPQQPFAVVNLHGDIQTYQRQFKFLASISSATFILLEEIPESCELFIEGRDQFYFMLGHSSHCFRDGEAKHLLDALSSFGLTKHSFLTGTEQNPERTIQEIIKNIIRTNPKPIRMTDMTLDSAFGFITDENQVNCQYAKLHSLELAHDIVLAIKYNENELKSQKYLRVQFANAEKEMCHLLRQGATTMEHIKSEKMWRRFNRYILSDAVTDLVYAFTLMSQAQKRYFLKWMQFHCPKASTNSLLEEAMQRNILYDLAHIYQAESIIIKATGKIPRLSDLPKTAADLLLDGFPLTLISEETFSVPFQWINDVLSDLVNKTKGPCRVRVISALGVCNTGKSTLLYTMFGLQFQITRPQHTKGALMSLLKVEDGLKGKLDCDFVLVIDTEGLRSPKLASAEERFEHDNALATFVIGISDIAIINLSSESPSDIINILQIAVCSFLRMKDLGRKPTLYFVQNKVPSSDGDIRNKSNVYEYLSETMDLAANVVKRAGYLSLNDVLKCDFLNSQWFNYMPSLWHSDPFNGCINSNYIEKVKKLKQHLIYTLTHEPMKGSLRTMQDFVNDIKSLWNAVNLEPILRFEHIKDVIIYKELSNLYREVELSMHKEMYQWKSKKEEEISISFGLDTLKKDMLEQLQKIKQEKIQSFGLSLDSEKKQFEGEFMEKFQYLSQELETFYKEKCTEILILRHGMERAIVEDFRSQEWDPDELEANFNFDLYCKGKADQLESSILKNLDILNEFMQILKKEMGDRGSLVTEALHNVETWSDHAGESFTINETHIDPTWNTRKEARDNTKPWSKLESVVQFLTKRCIKYVLTMVKLKKDYEPIHCLEILQMINKVIRRESFPFTDLFEVDLKFQILRKASAAFQTTHNVLLKAKEDKLFLEKEKPLSGNSFKTIIQDKRSAKRFCNFYLKPAIEQFLTSTLQLQVTQDIVRTVSAIRKSRSKSHILNVAKSVDLVRKFSHYFPFCDLQANAISATIELLRRTLLQHTEMEYDSVGALMTAVCSELATKLPLLAIDKKEFHLHVISSTPQQFSSYVDFFLRQLENKMQLNRNAIRNIILRVCERISRYRKKNQHSTTPYDTGYKRRQRNPRPFHQKNKPRKTIGPHSRPKRVPIQRVYRNMMPRVYIFAMNNKRKFQPLHPSQMHFSTHNPFV
ncbi:up-regulator of cell proliferation-like [Pyxicephalus adspersus]|uniref:up-regulator of cell proliferation-like n=1 Tax=Pyxicephalus adspersus TaxID=30357 RepID=UPI003B5B8CEB